MAEDWTDEEQRLLEEALVTCSGLKDVKEKWKAVALIVGTRGAKSCAERFKTCREWALERQRDAEAEAEAAAAAKSAREAAEEEEDQKHDQTDEEEQEEETREEKEGQAEKHDTDIVEEPVTPALPPVKLTPEEKAAQRASEVRREVEANRERLRRREEETSRKEAKKAAELEEQQRAFAAAKEKKQRQQQKDQFQQGQGSSSWEQGWQGDKGSGSSDSWQRERSKGDKGRGPKGKAQGKGDRGKSQHQPGALLFNPDEMPALPTAKPKPTGDGGGPGWRQQKGVGGTPWGTKPIAPDPTPMAKADDVRTASAAPASAPLLFQRPEDVPDSWDD